MICVHDWVVITRHRCRVERGVIYGLMRCRHCGKETSYRKDEE